jgi:quercetin dioxygenase-like cupin family protein
MSIPPLEANHDGTHRTAGGLVVPAGTGPTKWFSGDVYTIKATAAQTNGSLGLIEASVPPGGGPVPHTHPEHDEAFYLIAGQLEFTNGDNVYTAGSGDFVFAHRGDRHHFKNVGLHPAKLLFFYTPGGVEQVFIEGGDEPRPGEQVPNWPPERFTPDLQALLIKYGTYL